MTNSNALESHFTQEAAREFTDGLKADYLGLQGKIAAAWQGRIWLALGYSDWQEYLDGEFSGVSLRPPKAIEQQVLEELDEAGMSTRGIASALDMAQRTVVDRLDGGERNRSPRKKTGLDGKSYPARRPGSSPALNERHEDIIDVEPMEDDEFPGQVSLGDELGDDRWSSNGDRLASEMGIEAVELSVGSTHRESREFMRKQYVHLVGQAGGGIPAVSAVVNNLTMALQVSPVDHKLSAGELEDVAESAAGCARQLASLLVEITRATVHPESDPVPASVSGSVARDARAAVEKLQEIDGVLTDAGFRL